MANKPQLAIEIEKRKKDEKKGPRTDRIMALRTSNIARFSSVGSSTVNCIHMHNTHSQSILHTSVVIITQQRSRPCCYTAKEKEDNHSIQSSFCPPFLFLCCLFEDPVRQQNTQQSLTIWYKRKTVSSPSFLFLFFTQLNKLFLQTTNQLILALLTRPQPTQPPARHI